MWGNYSWAYLLLESCITKRKVNWIQRNPKEIEIMILLSYLFIFLTNFWVYHFFQVYHVFSDSGSFQCTQMNVFWCPGDPGTIPDWSWIDLGKIIFSWKFSLFEPHMLRPSSLKTHMYICISKPWIIWEFPDLKKLKIFKYNEIHQILPIRFWENWKTKLKKQLK